MSRIWASHISFRGHKRYVNPNLAKCGFSHHVSLKALAVLMRDTSRNSSV